MPAEPAGAVSIQGVEVLSVGTWNGIPLSRRDLEDMVAAFDATAGSLPVNIRLGHDARQAFARALFGAKAGGYAAKDEHGWPALGWADRLYIKGDTLLADVSGVPTRLATWIKEKRYRTRSGGLRFNRQVGGTVYRWMLDHIAILGADTPAVDGLADIGLADTDVDREVEITFSATDADGLLTFGDAGGQSAETALDRLVAALSAAMDEHTPLVYGRRGAPMVRQLFAAFLAKLRESARAELPLSTGDETMTLSVEALRGLFNLAADTPAADVKVALEGADADKAGKVWEMAAALGIKDANGLALALGIILGMTATDYDAIAAKVMELAGIKPPEGETPPAGEPPAPGTPPDMSANAAPAVTPEMVQLSAAYTELAARTQALEAELARGKAVAQVEADARAKGLALPKPVFNVLVNLAAAGDKAAYDAVLGNTRGVPATELGTAGNGDETVELSAIELKFAKQHGVTPEQLKAQKLANAGRAKEA